MDDKLDPAERARFALENALADAYNRGRQEGRNEAVGLLSEVLSQVVTVRSDWSVIEKARRELQKWGV